MPFLGFAAIVNLALIVHAMRTGRPYYWIWIILLPGIGPVAYFVAEILPELLGSRAARQAATKAHDAIAPERHYKELAARLADSPTIENKRNLALECERLKRWPEAERLYRDALFGVHADDPDLLLGLARVQHAQGQATESLASLDRLREANPSFQAADAHLLYARALEDSGRLDDARLEYDAVAAYYPGAEARCRLALLLERMGDAAGARGVWAEVARRAERAPRHVRRMQKEWIDLARARLAALNQPARS